MTGRGGKKKTEFYANAIFEVPKPDELPIIIKRIFWAIKDLGMSKHPNSALVPLIFRDYFLAKNYLINFKKFADERKLFQFKKGKVNQQRK